MIAPRQGLENYGNIQIELSLGGLDLAISIGKNGFYMQRSGSALNVVDLHAEAAGAIG
jgi:hypothetical protein